MKAWMQAGGYGILIASMLLAGCGDSKDAKVQRADGRQTVQVPVDEPDKITEAPEAEILASTHLAAGRLHESQGRIQPAIEQYRLAVATDPGCVAAWNRLGIVLDQVGQFSAADDAFRNALRHAPQQPYLHNNLGFSYVMQRRWADAEQTLREAVRLQPAFARARVNLAMVLAQQDRFDESLAQFHAALSPASAWYNQGLMYQSRKRPVDAARAFQTALSIDPGLTAAEKRLASLPADAVKQAEELGIWPATPTAETATADASKPQEPVLNQSSEPAEPSIIATDADPSPTVPLAQEPAAPQGAAPQAELEPGQDVAVAEAAESESTADILAMESAEPAPAETELASHEPTTPLPEPADLPPQIESGPAEWTLLWNPESILPIFEECVETCISLSPLSREPLPAEPVTRIENRDAVDWMLAGDFLF